MTNQLCLPFSDSGSGPGRKPDPGGFTYWAQGNVSCGGSGGGGCGGDVGGGGDICPPSDSSKFLPLAPFGFTTTILGFMVTPCPAIQV